MPKSKKFWIISAVLFLLLLTVPGYFLWINSPYYTVQEIGMAVNKKDSDAFHRCVDVDTLVDTVTTELLYEPAMNTPGLSELQKYVCMGSVGMTKSSIDRALTTQIENLVTPHFGSTSRLRQTTIKTFYHPNQPLQLIRNNETFRNCLYIKEPADIRLAGGIWNDLANVVGKSVKAEGEQQKQNFIRRMQEFAFMHPHYLISRLVLSPGQSRGTTIKTLLNEYGFAKENFRQRFQFRDNDKGQVLDIYFYSPKVAREVQISIQFTKDNPDELLSRWRLKQLIDVKQTFLNLGEDTDREVQELVAYSLQDVTTRNAWKSGGNILKRLGENEDTRKLWEKLKGRL